MGLRLMVIRGLAILDWPEGIGRYAVPNPARRALLFRKLLGADTQVARWGDRRSDTPGLPLCRSPYRFTVNTALTDWPLAVAVIVTAVFVFTLEVRIVKFPLLDPARTMIELLTEATAGLLLDRLIQVPAVLDRVIVPVALEPPRTDEGESDIPVGKDDADTDTLVLAAAPGNPSLSTATTEAV